MIGKRGGHFFTVNSDILHFVCAITGALMWATLSSQDYNFFYISALSPLLCSTTIVLTFISINFTIPRL